MIRLLSLALAAFFLSTIAQASQLKFTYLYVDGAGSYECRHKDAPNDSGIDFVVQCDVGGVLKSFDVHFWVTAYKRPTPPAVTYQVLYWITNNSRPEKAVGTSSSQWIHLRDPSALSMLEFRQGVDDDNAYLEATYIP